MRSILSHWMYLWIVGTRVSLDLFLVVFKVLHKTCFSHHHHWLTHSLSFVDQVNLTLILKGNSAGLHAFLVSLFPLYWVPSHWELLHISSLFFFSSIPNNYVGFYCSTSIFLPAGRLYLFHKRWLHFSWQLYVNVPKCYLLVLSLFPSIFSSANIDSSYCDEQYSIYQLIESCSRVLSGFYFLLVCDKIYTGHSLEFLSFSWSHLSGVLSFVLPLLFFVHESPVGLFQV